LDPTTIDRAKQTTDCILARWDGAPQGEAFALEADVPVGNGNTLYNKFRDWVGWLSLAGFVFLAVFMQVGKRGKKG
jgi:apolipoprotein N-acyltransferase